MKDTNETAPKVTAAMRFKSIRFDRVAPAHILAAIQASRGRVGVGLLRLSVLFSDNGEPYAVLFKFNGQKVGLYTCPAVGSSGFSAHYQALPPEVVAYLSHAADEALAIVSPLVGLH